MLALGNNYSPSSSLLDSLAASFFHLFQYFYLFLSLLSSVCFFVSITLSISYNLFSASLSQCFPLSCRYLTPSIVLCYVHRSLLCICTSNIWVQACLVGALYLQHEAGLSASLFTSCHENQTDTLNWCSRLKETGLKYLHNFTEDGGNC